MKFLEKLIESFIWLWIFSSPTIILGFIGFVIYYNNKGIIGIMSFIGLLVLGIVLGIYFAEKIRRSIGCTAFISRLHGWNNSKNDEK